MTLARDLVHSLPSAFTLARATQIGMTEKHLRGRQVERLFRGVYGATAAPPELVAICRALADVLPTSAVFSHHTAALLLGLPAVGRPTTRVHVTTPAGVDAPRRRGVQGHECYLPERDVDAVDGLPVTSAARTFVDHAAGTSLEDLVALGDGILHHRLATQAELSALVLAAAGQRGVRTARAALPLLDGRAQSVPESLLRVRIHFSDLPDAEPQLEVCDDQGNAIGHVDLGYDELRIAIEYDGRHHAEREEQFDYDVGRYTELESLGWHVMRAARGDLRNGSEVFLRRLRRLIASRSRSPSVQ